MILSEHMTQMVVSYCNSRGIKMIRGMVPAENYRQVQAFLDRELKHDRICTKNKEALDSTRIKNIVLKTQGELIGKCESPIEDYLYKALENEGVIAHFVSQLEIGKYRVDFACPLAKLIVECDGKKYHFTDQEQIDNDQKRDKYLAKKGWRVIHLEGYAIRKNITLCISKIMEQIAPYLRSDNNRKT